MAVNKPSPRAYRAHVHMFTIIQFMSARANIHTVLKG